ncbi:rifin [Plasmodium reichenowi]|uniref:Rifin n=1 Tax=Plasmodium reichenowi TaxID=5854 RepID=A0A060RMM7_PLARE|nr:rifin [Plasmodium reichenowi]
MKVHYINILLFALPLNIFVSSSHKKPHTTPRHAHKIPTSRLLCECELYAPANYDNDPQMKKVMQQFDDRTSQRFHEYDERMKTTRQKCKEQCDKEIEKIILKDKLEKELTEKFATLHTDIQSDAIPTCICEKSMADKVEKGCLRCAGVLGGTLPELGAMGATALYALSQWQTKAIADAIIAAKEAGALAGEAAGNALGMEIVNAFLKGLSVDKLIPGISKSIGNAIPFNGAGQIADAILGKYSNTCMSLSNNTPTICTTIGNNFNIIGNNSGNFLPADLGIKTKVSQFVKKATDSAAELTKTTTEKVTADLTAEKTGEIASIYASWQTPIIASIVAIVVIVLIMVIIYLILRYRRKKRMKKKLQYIKLLEE